ncbi:hypothetical protein SAMN05443639_1083 [Stigmatella erecta]|uniref:Uncharacterized protein n=1 Tax=Stigmatella erecta TaxID=83460 RepID=A0A1I0JSP7_9BACT|nr:hypothetical protein SAMN05443639_1083 [Stigmatella erecta]
MLRSPLIGKKGLAVVVLFGWETLRIVLVNQFDQFILCQLAHWDLGFPGISKYTISKL